MKERNIRNLILFLAVVGLIGTGVVFGQGPPRGTPEARALELSELLNSIEGVGEEPPRVFKTKEGYLRFIMAPPSTHFAVEPSRRRTPKEAAEWFLERWRDLFVSESPAVAFDVIRITTSDSRNYVRYQQRYAGLEVKSAEIVVQVNAAGGIVAVISDIMRDTEALDSGQVSLNPAIDASTARSKAVEFLAVRYPDVRFGPYRGPSRAPLMLFCPAVVGKTDDTVGHEFTHGVIESTYPPDGLTYSGESGAIEESLCDMWGEWIDQTYDHPPGEPNEDDDSAAVKWQLFEDDWASDPYPWRVMDDPTSCKTSSYYGEDFGDINQPDCLYGEGWYYGNDDYGGVHHNLGVGNKLCYLLTVGDTFNNYTISPGLGIPKAADLFYEALPMLTESCDYYDLGNVLQLAAVTEGLNQSERENVEKACRAVEIYIANWVFHIEDSSGTPVAWFDDLGNLILKGSLTQNTTPTRTANDEFRVEDSSGADVAIIDATNENMYISGSLFEEQTTLNPPANSFVVKNSYDVPVAYISDSGDVYLKGKLYQR